jgi:CheY-like chemotaxis protein
MRIHQEHATRFAKALASSLAKDPISLSAWKCIQIKHSDESTLEQYARAIADMKRMHVDTDCEVLHTSDNDVFFISDALSIKELERLAAEFWMLCDGAGEPCESSTYELLNDSNAIRKVMEEKAALLKVEDAPEAPPVTFGDTAALKDVFAEAKQLRRGRHPLHVMVVEDDPLTRRVVANAFKENYALITAQAADEAIAQYMLHAPDVVFMDIGLPDASGFDVMQQILEIDPDAYVVMFSGNSYLDNVTKALNSGASGFVAKPFKQNSLRHYILDGAHHHHKSCA